MSRGSIHDVRPEAFRYVWDRSIPPAVEVEPGDAVVLHARDASDEQIHPGSSAADVAGIDFAHVNPVSGPVFVKGARPGDVLAVELLELEPSGWGWTAIIPGFGLLAEDFPEPWLRISEIDPGAGTVRFSDRIELPLRPFPGTIGVAPAETGEHSVLPPTRWGGNLDTRHLTAGSTLYLPVGAERALLSIGDTHAAQGDGEVCGTAIESAMDVSVRVSVRHDLSISAPQLDVPAAAAGAAPAQHVCTGVGPDPDGRLPRRGARDDRVPRPPPRARPGGGLCPDQRRVRSADPRTGRRAQLGRRRLSARRHLRVSRQRHDAATEAMPNVAMPPEAAGMPDPGGDLISRVVGGADRTWFYWSGRESVRDLQRTLAVAGRKLDSFSSILDFGCGCGRMLLWLKELARPGTLHGTDVDRETVGWGQTNLSHVELTVNHAEPPLPYPDRAFDLVFSHSVFTHLDEQRQDIWLSELRRVTRRGGYLVLSVQGEAALGDDVWNIRERLQAEGIVFIDGVFGPQYPLPGWYQNSYHAAWYVREHWGRWFEICAHVPRGALGVQDQILLART